jgi:hypothetical protein
MAYDTVTPIVLAIAMGLAGSFMFVWGLMRPRPTTSDKVRWVGMVLMFYTFCVGQAVVAQRQGISDPSGPLGKAAAYGVRSAEVLGLTAAATSIAISIYGGMDARLFIPGIAGLGVMLPLVIGSLVHNIGFNYYMWFTLALAFWLVYIFVVLFIDNADWVAGIILRDNTHLPKWNNVPFRIVLILAPALFVVLSPFAADTTGGISFTVFFILTGLFEVAVAAAVVINYFVYGSVDIISYTPVDQAANADLPLTAPIGGSTKRNTAANLAAGNYF